MYLSLSEHDDAYITTECSPYNGSNVPRKTEQVDYSGNTTFESPDDYFLRQSHNDSIRTLDAVKKWEKKKIQQNVAQLKTQKELIMHDKIANEQAFKRATPNDNLLAEALMQTLGSEADFNRLAIWGDGASADGLPYSTDYEQIVCGEPYGPPAGTPVTMGFLDWDKLVADTSKSATDQLQKEIDKKIQGSSSSGSSSSSTKTKVTTVLPTAQAAFNWKDPMVLAGLGIGGLGIILLVMKAMKK